MTNVSRWIGFSLPVGLVVYVVKLHVLGYQPHRSIRTDVVQGIIVGASQNFHCSRTVARLIDRLARLSRPD
jgi:hypothetical protein